MSAPAAPQTAWVRTADGWQPRGVLAVEPTVAEPMHPGLIAGFQLAFSLLVLIALPAQAKPAAARMARESAAIPLQPRRESAGKRRRRISRALSA